MRLQEHEVWVAQQDGVVLYGCLSVPDDPHAVVVFAEAGSSGRRDPHSRALARFLSAAGMVTLVVDLLTEDEVARDAAGQSRSHQDIDLLARRLVGTSRWLPQLPLTRGLGIGYYGAGPAGSAALAAAGREPHRIGAVVVRAGRLDLLDDEQLASVWAPTLLLAHRSDPRALQASRDALERMATEKQLALLPSGETPFEQGGVLEYLAGLSRDWFLRHLAVVTQPWGTGTAAW